MTLAAIKAAALAVMLELPRAWFPADNRPETLDERETRIAGFVSDVVDEADTHAPRAGLSVVEGAALGLAFAYNESALAWEVHAGTPWPQRPPPFGKAGERCLFQLHRSAAAVPLDDWRPFEPEDFEALTGLDAAATRRCARAGVLAITWHAHLCRGYLREYRDRGDHMWVGATISGRYHEPSNECGALSSGSIRRGKLYAAILYQLQKRTAAAGR